MARIVSLLIAFFACLSLPAAGVKWHQHATKASDPALTATYQRLTEPVPLKGRQVSGLALARPGIKILMETGTLGMEDQPVTNGSRGYVFTGKARLDFSVTDPVERAHMKLFTGKEEWQGLELGALYLLPTGPSDPFQGNFPEPMLEPADLAGLKYALHWDGLSALANLLNKDSRKPEDLLVLFSAGGDLWCYRFDSEQPEEVALLRLGKPAGTDGWWWDPVVSLHLNGAGELSPENSAREVNAKFRQDVGHIGLDLAVSASGMVTSGKASLAFTPLKQGTACLLWLDPMLAVTKVHTGEGAPLPFLQMDYSKLHASGEWGLLVVLPEGSPKPVEIVVEYGGELFETTPLRYLILKQEDMWYPSLPDADGQAFDISVTVPAQYEALSIGDLVERTTAGSTATYHYRFSDRSSLATLAVGTLRHFKQQADGVAVEVAFPDSVWTAAHQTNEEATRTLIFNCIKIDTKLYGPPRYNKLSVALCGSGHGRGFPTLLLLSTLSDQSMIAHETGHQWWGNIVEPLTYRDAWISEALAQLAAYDYAMVIYGPKKVKESLDRVELDLDMYLSSSYKPTWSDGPILLGGRLNNTLEPISSYQTIVYGKGAWAMVNLRKIAVASPAHSMQAFYDALQDFLRTYSGQKATTADFQKVMERHLRMDLGWFFDQYFRRTEIPNVTVKARAERTSAGWRLVAEGTQDTDFRLYIPIQFALDKNSQEVIFRLDGRQGRQEFDLPGEPSSVKVDGLNETLARVKS